MDKLLHNTRNKFAIIDILIVTKGTKRQMEKLEASLTILDEAGIRLKLEKCKIAKTKRVARIQTFRKRSKAN